jgi:putative ABC transport system permease protein
MRAPTVTAPKSALSTTDLVRVGAVGLRTRKLRAALSALGIAIGIASMVAVIGISDSSRADLLAALDRLGTNLLTVSAGSSVFGEASTLPEEAEEMVRRIGPVQDASAVTSVSANVYRSDQIPQFETNGLSVVAADPDLLDTLGGTVAEGAFLNRGTARYPTVVLGSVAAERLGITGAGIGAQVWLGERWFTVIGILDPLPLSPDLDRSVLIGRPIAERLLDASESASQIYVRADPEDVEAVQSVLAATANPENPEEVSVARPSDALEARDAAERAFTSLLVGLGAVALLVGGIGIANVMVISVLERRSEIGLRRALGATKRHVRAQFLTEALILSAIGGIAGAGIGAIVTVAFARSQEWAVVVPPIAIASGVGAALLIGAIAGLYPAIRAARLSPTDALRSV